MDVSDSAPSALATNASDEHSSASSDTLRDSVSGSMRDPSNRGGGGVAGAQKITQEEDLA